MKIGNFNLMSYRHLPDDFAQKYESVYIELPSELLDPEQMNIDYNASLDELEFEWLRQYWAQGEEHDALRGRLGRHEVQIRELGDRMPDLLVDGTGDLAALDVGKRDVQVARRDSGGQGLEAVRDGHDDVGLEVVERRRQFDDTEAGGLG